MPYMLPPISRSGRTIRYDFLSHRECARDKPVDRTATCLGKVLKLERWLTDHRTMVFLFHSLWLEESGNDSPHSSAFIPSEYLAMITIGYLEDEIRIMTDWHTDALFSYDNAERIAHPVSRLITDP